MRPPGSAEKLEARRRHAIRMLRNGVPVADVSRRLDVSRQSVSRWLRAFEKRGERGLKATPHPGPRPKLDDGQRSRLQKLLLKGPRAHGYRSDVWTRRRVVELIQRHFAIGYHVDHMSRLMVSLGWRCRKLSARARALSTEGASQWVHPQWHGLHATPVHSAARAPHSRNVRTIAARGARRPTERTRGIRR